MKPKSFILMLICLLIAAHNALALYEWDILDKQPRRAIWVWGAGGEDKYWDGQPRWHRLVDNYKKSADLLIDFCRNKSIRDIYLYIGAWEWEQPMFTSYQLYNEAGYEYIVTNAKKYCIKVYGLFYLWDDPNKLSDYQTAIENIVDSVVKYNERHPDGMLAGIQSDQEPYQDSSFDELLNMFQTGEDRIKYWKDRGSLGAEYFLFSHAISPAFIFTPFTWKGTKKKMYEHVMDVLDHAALMDYYDDSVTILSRAIPIVDYATKVCKPVAIGVETGWLKVSDPNTFNNEIRSESVSTRFDYMESELSIVVNTLSSYDGFEGIAIHSWSQYFYHWFGAQPGDWLDSNTNWTASFVDICKDSSPWAGLPYQSGPDCPSEEEEAEEPGIKAVENRTFQPGNPGQDKFQINFNKTVRFILKIMDARGNIVTTISGRDTLCEWDGKDDNGNTIKEGLYFYILNYEGKEKKGICVMASPKTE